LLTYQIWIRRDAGVAEQFIVALWDLATLEEKIVTHQGENYYPSFSNDGKHLVYLSNRAGTGGWELYALPVVNDTVPVDTVVAPVQLTDTGGIMNSGEIPDVVPMAWSPNPADPVLATLNNNDKLHLVPTDTTGGSGDLPINIPGSVRDFEWSPDGRDIMVTTGGEIYRVSRTGVPMLVVRLPGGDNASRLVWSRDQRFLLYSVKRSSSSWYELFDLDGSLGLDAPLTVSPAGAAGESAAYDDEMDIRPVWAASSPTAYLLFFDSGPTPSISTISFGGLTP
jgi:hypothetical protein